MLFKTFLRFQIRHFSMQFNEIEKMTPESTLGII